MIIYVIVCCPQGQGVIICVCMLICIYIYVIVFYFVFSAFFYWGRAKFNKFNYILALCVLVCVYKFGIIQYILKYKCICICILSYYTYSGTEYSDSLFDHNTWVLCCLFSYFAHLCLPWGVFCTPIWEEYSNCRPNRGLSL